MALFDSVLAISILVVFGLTIYLKMSGKTLRDLLGELKSFRRGL